MKTFKTFDELVSHLNKNKNILISNNIEILLKERTYASVINSYKLFFSTGIDSNHTHIYDNEIDFEKYISLANLDDEISHELHKLIGYLEKKLKNILAYEYSNFLSSINDPTCTSYVDSIKNLIVDNNSQNNLDNLAFKPLDKNYTNRSNLMNASQGNITYRVDFLSKIIEIASNNKKTRNDLISHYQLKQDVVPFWIIVHSFTMGELIEFIELLNMPLRINIYNHFTNNFRPYDVNPFFNNLNFIKHLRNIVNHYEPIIPFIKNDDTRKIRKALDILEDNFDNIIVKNHNNIDLDQFENNSINSDLISKTKLLKTII